MGMSKAFISYCRGDAPHQSMDLHRAVAYRLG
jgi:hypothetical protein